MVNEPGHLLVCSVAASVHGFYHAIDKDWQEFGRQIDECGWVGGGYLHDIISIYIMETEVVYIFRHLHRQDTSRSEAPWSLQAASCCAL
jgi:hypothetical protein